MFKKPVLICMLIIKEKIFKIQFSLSNTSRLNFFSFLRTALIGNDLFSSSPQFSLIFLKMFLQHFLLAFLGTYFCEYRSIRDNHPETSPFSYYFYGPNCRSQVGPLLLSLDLFFSFYLLSWTLYSICVLPDFRGWKNVETDLLHLVLTFQPPFSTYAEWSFRDCLGIIFARDIDTFIMISLFFLLC